MSTPNPKTLPITPSQFTHALTKSSITQILKQTGFKSSKSSALDAFSRITTLFITHLTASASSHSPNSHPHLLDLVFALENFHFPLDFSPRSLARFLATDPPRPRCIAIPSIQSPAVVIPARGGGVGKRGPEVPAWLPGFPEAGVDEKSDNIYNRGEVYWEEGKGEGDGEEGVLTEKAVVVAKGKGKGKGENVGKGRRERVKFRIVGSKRKAKVGNVEDLELRNGVCRGGKRICLVKKVNNLSNLFVVDDEDDDDN